MCPAGGSIATLSKLIDRFLPARGLGGRSWSITLTAAAYQARPRSYAPARRGALLSGNNKGNNGRCRSRIVVVNSKGFEDFPSLYPSQMENRWE